MKRCLIILFCVVNFIIMAGCAFPTGKDVQATDNTLAANESSTADMPDNSAYTEGTGSNDNKGNEPAGKAEAVQMLSVTMYYQDEAGYLIPMTRWVDKQPGIAKAALCGLTDSAVTREELQYYGVYPVLPVNTEVLGINIKDGIAVVDFNSKLLEYSNADMESNIITSIVYTLTEFPTISSVRIVINGHKMQTLKYGTDISGLLGRSNTPINSKLERNEAKTEVYYLRQVDEGFIYLLPVSVGANNIEEPGLQLLIKNLLKPKTDERLISEIPSGVELLNTTNKFGVLTIDFNEKFLDFGGNTREDSLLKQLLFTAKQAGGISKLKITVNGAPAELPEGTDISQGIAVPNVINDVIDR